MQLKFTTTYASTRCSSHAGRQTIVAEDVVLDGATDTLEILPQLDQAVVIEWLVQQGYDVSVKQEHAA